MAGLLFLIPTAISLYLQLEHSCALVLGASWVWHKDEDVLAVAQLDEDEDHIELETLRNILETCHG
jgi:urease accessory protein UreE